MGWKTDKALFEVSARLNRCGPVVVYPLVLLWTPNCDEVLPSADAHENMPHALFACKQLCLVRRSQGS